MKKILSVLLSVLMLLTIGVVNVSAEVEPEPNGGLVTTNVAKIGDKNYTTLAEAFADAKANDVVVLLENVTLEENLELSFDIDGIVFLDLNEKTLQGRINLKKGKLEINNGYIVGGDKQPLNVYGSSTEASNYSVLTIGQGVVVEGDKFGVCMFGNTASTDGWGAVVNIYGKVSTEGTGTEGTVFVSGNLGKGKTASENNSINIFEDAVITSEKDAALALNGNADVNIFDGAYLGGVTAITVKRGLLNVNGGTIISLGELNEPGTQEYNGTEMTGAAISITETYNQYGPLTVNIIDGDISSAKGHSIFKREGSYPNGANVSVKGGHFSDLECLNFIDRGATEANPVHVALNKDVTNARGISVPSGTNVVVDFAGKKYSVEKPGAGSAGTKTIAFQLLENSNITFKNGKIECTQNNKDDTWTSADTEKGIAMIIQNYANLILDKIVIDGTNIAHNGSSVRYIMSNNSGETTIKDDSKIIAPDGDFAFDSCKYGSYTKPTVNVEGSIINGKVEASGGNINFKPGAVVNGQIRVGENKNGGATGSNVVISNGATVNNQGKYAAIVFGQNSLNIAGEINGIVGTNGNEYNAGSIIEVSNGASITEDNDVAMYIPNGTLNIYGGTITGTTAVYFKSTNLKITDGVLRATGAKTAYKYNGNGGDATGDALVIDSCNYPSGINSIEITGGKFYSTNANAIAAYESQEGPRQTGKVSGGLFNTEIAADLVASPKIVIANTDKDTKNVYPYTVGTKSQEIEVDTKGKQNENKNVDHAAISGVGDELVNAVAQEVKKTNIDLKAEALALANNPSVINAEVVQTVKNALNPSFAESIDQVEINVNVTLKQTLTDVKSNATNPTKLKSFKVDITPVYSIVAVNKVDNTKPNLIVATDKAIRVNRTTLIKVYLPSGFASEAGTRVYVKHLGNVYGDENDALNPNGIFTERDTDGIFIKFFNPDGFSEFEFSLDRLVPDSRPDSGHHYNVPNTGVR